jgi:hypothetical protein
MTCLDSHFLKWICKKPFLEKVFPKVFGAGAILKDGGRWKNWGRKLFLKKVSSPKIFKGGAQWRFQVRSFFKRA